MHDGGQGFGRIFDEGIYTLLAVGGNTTTRFPTKEQVLLAGETLFAKAAETDHVDIFVGNSWSAGRWLKVMALCEYFNLGKAVACSMLTWLIAVSVLLTRGGWTGLGGSYLALPCLVYLPMVTFFIVLVFGQQLCDHFCGFAGPSLWLDVGSIFPSPGCRACYFRRIKFKKKPQHVCAQLHSASPSNPTAQAIPQRSKTSLAKGADVQHTSSMGSETRGF